MRAAGVSLHQPKPRLFCKAAGALIPLRLLSEKGHAVPSLLACRRARSAPACYQPFSGCESSISLSEILKIFFIVLSHVGAKSALLRLIFCKNKPSARSLAPPFSQKVTLGSPVRLQAPSQRFAVATNFLRAARASLYQPKPSPIGKLQKNRGKAKGLPSKSFWSHRAIGAAL